MYPLLGVLCKTAMVLEFQVYIPIKVVVPQNKRINSELQAMIVFHSEKLKAKAKIELILVQYTFTYKKIIISPHV